MTLLKKTVYDKLVAKVSHIDTNGFVLETKYDTGISDLEKNFLILVGLLKINKIEGKIPRISDLANNSALTEAENKIPYVNSLVEKKADYSTKSSQIKRNLLIIIMTNILLLLQNLICFQQKTLLQD